MDSAKSEPQNEPHVTASVRIEQPIICRIEKSLWDKIKPYLEGGGLLCLLIYTFFTIRMYHATKQAADAATTAANTAQNGLEDARKNFIADQRPIIWLTNDVGEPKVIVTPQNPGMVQLLWTWHFTNYGKRPTNELRYRQYFKFGDEPPIISYGENGDDIGAPIPPGKTDFATVVSAPMKRAELVNLVKAGAVGIRVVITYTDVAQSKYETRICLQRTNVGSISYCSDGDYIK
jgi:hypothetical protein